MMSVRKISSAWKRKQAKKVARNTSRLIFRYKVRKAMPNARFGPRFNLGNRSDTRLMNRRPKKRN
jgi:hypothetical protein